MLLQRFYGFGNRISSFTESWSAKWPSFLGFWLEFAQYGAEGCESAHRAYVAARQNFPSITSESEWKFNKKIGEKGPWAPSHSNYSSWTFAQSSAFCFEALALPVAPKHSRRHHWSSAQWSPGGLHPAWDQWRRLLLALEMWYLHKQKLPRVKRTFTDSWAWNACFLQRVLFSLVTLSLPAIPDSIQCFLASGRLVQSPRVITTTSHIPWPQLVVFASFLQWNLFPVGQANSAEMEEIRISYQWLWKSWDYVSNLGLCQICSALFFHLVWQDLQASGEFNRILHAILIFYII